MIATSQVARITTTLRDEVSGLDEDGRRARAQRIKRLRQESAYTQPAIAEAVGVTLRAYQRWEEGGGIEWEHLESLAELHGVEPQWIHRGRALEDGTRQPGGATADELLAEIRSLRTVLLAEIGKVQTALEARLRRRETNGHGSAGNDS